MDLHLAMLTETVLLVTALGWCKREVAYLFQDRCQKQHIGKKQEFYFMEWIHGLNPIYMFIDIIQSLFWLYIFTLLISP